ncbi:hypothetical protein Angca_010019, partial [Angiostrongylus cantonensis]
VLPALTYASETWSLRASRSTQVRKAMQGFDQFQRSEIEDAVLYAEQSKMRCARHVIRMNDNRWTKAVSDWVPRDVERAAGRPPTRWSE